MLNKALQNDLNKYSLAIEGYLSVFYLIQNSRKNKNRYSACLEFHVNTENFQIENFYLYCAFYKLQATFHFWPGIILAKFPVDFEQDHIESEAEKILKTFNNSGIQPINSDKWYEYYLDYFLDNYHSVKNILARKNTNLLIDQRAIEISY
mgnify:FL=1